MSFCTQCGKPLGKDDRFCPGCGVETPNADTGSARQGNPHSRPLPQTAEHKNPSAPGSRWLPLAFGLAGLGIAGLLTIVFLSTRSKRNPGTSPDSNQANTASSTTPAAETRAGVSTTTGAETPLATATPTTDSTEAMATANDFYAWYLDKWIEPELEPDWFEKNEKLTPALREAWRKLQQQAERDGEGLDYDPVVYAQEMPPGGFRAVHGESGGDPGTVRVIMLAVGWDFTLDVRMRKSAKSGAWQIDAIQDLNQDFKALKPVTITPESHCRAVAEGFLATLRSGMVDRAWWLLSSRHREQLPSGDFRGFLEGMGMLDKNRSAVVKPWDPGDGSVGMEAVLKAPGKPDDLIAFQFTKDENNGWLIDSFVVPGRAPRDVIPGIR